MRDLYRRNNLRPLESDVVKISNCKSADQQDNEAAFIILLNQERKKQYDKVYSTLKTIGVLRERFSCKANAWNERYPDFIAEQPEKPVGEEPAPTDPKRNSNSYYIMATVCAVVLLFVVFISTPSKNENTVGIADADQTKVLKHAIDDSVLVRDMPSMSANVIGEIRQFHDVEVEKGKAVNGWDYLLYKNIGGYIQQKQLAMGSGYDKYNTQCRGFGLTRPDHGASLFHPIEGPHALTVINPPGEDAIVKLKDSSTDDLLVYYLHGGHSITLNNVPEGEFWVLYATGENFSPHCGHFVDHMSAWRDIKRIKFVTTYDGQLTVTTNELLNIKNRLAENVTVDPRDF